MTAHGDEARFWDRHAREYAASAIKDTAGYERTLERTRHYLKASDTVLEIGCGTGTTALRLAPHIARIVATDVSPEMIAIAREKASAQGCANAEFAVATADGAAGPDGAFDAVLAFSLLHLVRARASALAQVHRLLRPGGLFITKTPCLSEMNAIIRLALPVMRAIGKAPHVDVFTAGELEREIAAAGFAILERSRHGSGRKDARIFIAAQKAGG